MRRWSKKKEDSYCPPLHDYSKDYYPHMKEGEGPKGGSLKGPEALDPHHVYPSGRTAGEAASTLRQLTNITKRIEALNKETFPQALKRALSDPETRARILPLLLKRVDEALKEDEKDRDAGKVKAWLMMGKVGGLMSEAYIRKELGMAVEEEEEDEEDAAPTPTSSTVAFCAKIQALAAKRAGEAFPPTIEDNNEFNAWLESLKEGPPLTEAYTKELFESEGFQAFTPPFDPKTIDVGALKKAAVEEGRSEFANSPATKSLKTALRELEGKINNALDVLQSLEDQLELNIRAGKETWKINETKGTIKMVQTTLDGHKRQRERKAEEVEREEKALVDKHLSALNKDLLKKREEYVAALLQWNKTSAAPLINKLLNRLSP